MKKRVDGVVECTKEEMSTIETLIGKTKPIFRPAVRLKALENDVERKNELMKLAARYIRDFARCENTIFYDGTDCDGICLADDLDNNS